MDVTQITNLRWSCDVSSLCINLTNTVYVVGNDGKTNQVLVLVCGFLRASAQWDEVVKSLIILDMSQTTVNAPVSNMGVSNQI